MSAFAEVEIEYLNAQRLGRMAMVGAPQFFRLRPHRVISWGLEGSESGERALGLRTRRSVIS
jgi:hypothetical protein